jgi:hypothetical protein
MAEARHLSCNSAFIEGDLSNYCGTCALLIVRESRLMSGQRASEGRRIVDGRPRLVVVFVDRLVDGVADQKCGEQVFRTTGR